jgi:hypothetical protein
MDPATALGLVWTGVQIVKGVQDIWNKWQQDRGTGTPQGLAFNSQGGMQEIPNVSGVLSVPDARSGYIASQEPPVTVGGDFLLEESLDWLRGDEFVLLLVLEESYESFGEFYLFDFDFNGYAVSLWPGDYSFYTFVLDPESPTMFDSEILAVGYPDFEELADPNPISVSGYGYVDMDMLVFDREAFYDVPRYLGELAA